MDRLTELPARIDTRFNTVRTVAETGSTNADLLEAAAAGASEGLVLVTDHQTAGRGRQSRQWHDEPGNALLVSVLLRPARSWAPLTPLLTGVAAVEAVLSLLPAQPGLSQAGTVQSAAAPVGLKWPNDVLAPSREERKLAGILTESTTAGQPADATTMAVVTGMGMNLRWTQPPPEEVSRRAVTLTEIVERSVERDEILDRYLRILELWLRRIEQFGPAVLLDRYRQHCVTLGRQLRFATSTVEYFGTATDVSDTGTLLMDTVEHGTVELHSGDAHHLP